MCPLFLLIPLGVWLGVEWDDASRGKHSGDHHGVHYFSCRLEEYFSATVASNLMSVFVWLVLWFMFQPRGKWFICEAKEDLTWIHFHRSNSRGTFRGTPIFSSPPFLIVFIDIVWFQRYGGSGGGEEEREMYVDVKPVELVGTDKITKKQRYPV